MKLRTAIVASFAILGLAVPGVASAHGNAHPTPSGDAAARAEAGLLAACKGQGFTALYTPIDSPFTVPATDNPNTPQDDREAEAFTFADREQCRNAVRAGLPIGLLARHPAGADFVTTPAPGGFPGLPSGNPVQPATLTLENIQDNPNDFSFVVRGVNFAPNADVSVLVATRDNRADLRLVGKTDANGVFTYRLVGGCDNTQAVSNVSAVQFTSGKTAQIVPPANLCA
jgi:hypothetical protein